MNDGGYTLWVGGGIVRSTFGSSKNEISAAGCKWQYGLISGTQLAGENIHALTHFPNLPWPKGPFISRALPGSINEGIKTTVAPFINIPKLRLRTIRRAYSVGLDKILSEHGLPKAAVFYNIWFHTDDVFNRLKRELKIPCIVIAADYPDRTRYGYLFENALKRSDGGVYLSWQRFDQSQKKYKLHLDGGITKIRTLQTKDRTETARNIGKPVILTYSGSYHKYCGIDRLIQFFKSIEDPHLRLHLTGKCDNERLLKLFRSDPRIHFFGFVTEKMLAKLQSETFAFVNFYLPDDGSTSGKFPSKILEYMSFGKPVLSTETAGVAPEYNKFVSFFDANNPSSFQSALHNLRTLAPEKNADQQQKVFKFLKINKAWSIQGRRLQKFIDNVIISGKQNK
ncbi:MAG: glycosyltransferase [Paludibacter sp.]|nr:glycosyltransferase [Paludibacter sp.]MDD4072533.1 glycosyltransferase [Desulfobacterales bacterium]MDD4428539.1 glycosyltransferase [Paludibacter sp.]